MTFLLRSAFFSLATTALMAQSGGYHPEPWPAGQTTLQAKSLPSEGFAVKDPDDASSSDPTFNRTFVITVQPGEKLEFKLEGEESRLALKTYIPVPAPTLKWKLALQNANIPLRSRRASRLELKNPTTEPQVLYLVLYGPSGYSYKLDMVRKPNA